MNYIDDNVLSNIKCRNDILDKKIRTIFLIAITNSIVIPLCIVPVFYGFKKFLIGTIITILALFINIALIIAYIKIKKRLIAKLLDLSDFDKKIEIINITDSHDKFDEFYKENFIAFKAAHTINVLSFIYNLLNNEKLINKEKIKIYTFYGKDLKIKFNCNKIDDNIPFICISRKDLNHNKLDKVLFHCMWYTGLTQYLIDFVNFVDEYIEGYDWNELDYYTDPNILKKYFEEFFDESNKAKNSIITHSFEWLNILAEHQWHTYKLLDNTLLEKVDKYIEDNIDIESEEIMNNILDIILYLGLENRFRKIITNTDKITNPKVIKLIKDYEKKYGYNINNPYNNLIDNKWRYELINPDCIIPDWSNIHRVEQCEENLNIYIDALYNPLYDKNSPEKETLYIYDCMICLKNVKIISEIAGGFIASKETRKYITFEEFCKKGCDELQGIYYNQNKRELGIHGYVEDDLVDLKFEFSSINLYWNK